MFCHGDPSGGFEVSRRSSAQSGALWWWKKWRQMARPEANYSDLSPLGHSQIVVWNERVGCPQNGLKSIRFSAFSKTQPGVWVYWSLQQRGVLVNVGLFFFQYRWAFGIAFVKNMILEVNLINQWSIVGLGPVVWIPGIPLWCRDCCLRVPWSNPKPRPKPKPTINHWLI